jgi:DNA-binding protein YbaB
MQMFGYLSKMKSACKNFQKQFKKYESYSSSAEDCIVKMSANGLVKMDVVY